MPDDSLIVAENDNVIENATYCSWRPGSMANLFKAYGNNTDKFNGSNMDSFEQKFMLFVERCDQADIPDGERHRAFLMILIRHARQYYFDALRRRSLDMDGLVAAVKSCSTTQECTRALLREWESLSLSMIVRLRNDSSPSTCLKHIIEKLTGV